ncbi:MAG: secondary thiamine-phosphate synthase enzyme YjbQ [Candidatus Heimdallarchaeota archaeon]|nr:secondary thiamine-phosphate synthase enzyme YjbQ [Candidatus Heimdallarchaeota archaeon]
MKSFRKALLFNTPTRTAFINITPQIEICLKESQIQEGLILVNAMHVTSSVFINDDEAGLHQDLENWMNNLVPIDPQHFRHNVNANDADAHIKREILGRETVIAVTEGKLDFGPNEQVIFGEFDGKRPKRVLIKIIGD